MAPFKIGTHKHVKGYPRVSAGPLRGQYIHRVVAEAKLGRPLTKDEDVHHIDGNKLNFHPANIVVLGHADHSWISTQQHHYMKTRDVKERAVFDEFFREKEHEL